MTPIGPNTPDLARDLAISPTGTIYGIFDESPYSIDKSTGATAVIGGLPTGNRRRPRQPPFDGRQQPLHDDRRVRQSPFPEAGTIGASGVDNISLGGFSSGAFPGTNVTDQPRLVSVNPLTGATEGAATGGVIYLIALDPTSVPEPATVATFAVGLIVLVVRKLRQPRFPRRRS